MSFEAERLRGGAIQSESGSMIHFFQPQTLSRQSIAAPAQKYGIGHM
jgi:hypothetical protein